MSCTPTPLSLTRLRSTPPRPACSPPPLPTCAPTARLPHQDSDARPPPVRTACRASASTRRRMATTPAIAPWPLRPRPPHPGHHPTVQPPRVCPTILLTSPSPDCPPDLTAALPSGPRASRLTSPLPGCLAPTCVPDRSPPGRPSDLVVARLST
jgi:hypothetical protein